MRMRNSIKKKILTCMILIIILLSAQSAFAKSYIYDNLGRLTTVEYDDGSQTSYIYDSSGNIKRAETISKDGVKAALPKGASDLTELVLYIGNPNMTINNKLKEIDPGRGTVPVIIDDRTLIPIRAIIESLNGAVSWNEAEQKVEITLEAKKVELWIDKTTVKVNGVANELDVGPRIINDRTMVPLRFVAETFDSDVQWEEKTQKITILR